LLSLLNPTLGAIPIGEIEPADVLGAIRKIEARAIWRVRGAPCNWRARSFAMPWQRPVWGLTPPAI
jgi:hypothetical protein